MMNRANRTAAIAVTLLLPLLIVSNTVVVAADEPPETSIDGLQLKKTKNLDLVYVKPGATLAAYTKVWLDPAEVAFSKDWEPPRQFTDKDREKIRTGLAEEFLKVFTKELQEKGGYQIVNSAGPDVLRVTAGIVDLYITAPDVSQKTAGRVNSYVISAGSMTLVSELRDSETGAILARVADRKSGRQSGPVQWATSGSNAAAARMAMSQWARVLREALDEAKNP